MRIAHVVDSLEIGGAECVASALARIHVREGHEVSVHCLYGDGPLAADIKQYGAEVFIHGPNSRWDLMRSLYGAFRKTAPGVIHCHNAAATIIAAPIARLARVPVVISTRHGLVSRPYARAQELKFGLVTSLFCRRVVAVCDAARRNLVGLPVISKDRVITILNGASPAPEQEHRMDVATDGKFILVNVARLAREKDQSTLLRAVALASRNHPELNLWLIGNGALHHQLRQLAEDLDISDRVRFVGETKYVGDYLKQANVFILSSITEGLPMSLLEAMAAGLPAIVTDVGGMPEVLRLAGGGEAICAGDPELMAAAIGRYASQRDRLAELGARARQSYQQFFTPERMAKAYIELYSQAAAG